MKTAKDILVEAKSLIINPENWLKGTFARNVSGQSCFELDADACQFCSAGAIYKAAHVAAGKKESAADAPRSFMSKAISELDLDHWTIAGFNDGPLVSHSDVMKAFDRAIELAGGAT
jgi:hypothetical protein